jgi:hypothetical protein
MIWEYKTAVISLLSNVYDAAAQTGFDVTETDQFLNIMGKDRWELVDVNPILTSGNTSQLAYFFKRPIINKPSSLAEIGYDIDNNGITGSQL